MTYDLHKTPALGPILKRHHFRMIDIDRRMQKVFPLPPRVTYKRGKNMRELLSRAKIPKASKVTRAARTENNR